MRGPKGLRRGLSLNELCVIPDGALLIRDGILVEVGPSRRVENLALARDAIEINAAGRVVMPGFVDSHTHLIFPPAGIACCDQETAARAVHSCTSQRLEVRTRAYLEAMARHGTTTVEAKTGCGPDEQAETKVLRVLAALQREPVDIVPSFLFRLPREQDGPDTFHAAADWVFSELLPKIRKRRVACFADLAWDCDPDRYSCFGRYLDVARRLGFACKIHSDQPSSSDAIAMALRHRVVSIDHLEYATEAEARILAESDVIATLLPCGSFRCGGRDAPARALIDAGVPIALGTNFNPHRDPTLSMQTVVAIACLRLRMTVAEAIGAATINGAHALGRADRVGSLEFGKSADLVILNVHDYREMEQNFGNNLVHLTMKRGEFIYKEGDVAPRAAAAVAPH